MVALVGPSGSGKSSIIKLIERLYDPEKGQLSLDGTSICDYDRRWLARKMALVGQEPVLFACSIRENIAYGLEVIFFLLLSLFSLFLSPSASLRLLHQN